MSSAIEYQTNINNSQLESICFGRSFQTDLLKFHSSLDGHLEQGALEWSTYSSISRQQSSYPFSQEPGICTEQTTPRTLPIPDFCENLNIHQISTDSIRWGDLDQRNGFYFHQASLESNSPSVELRKQDSKQYISDSDLQPSYPLYATRNNDTHFTPRTVLLPDKKSITRASTEQELLFPNLQHSFWSPDKWLLRGMKFTLTMFAPEALVCLEVINLLFSHDKIKTLIDAFVSDYITDLLLGAEGVISTGDGIVVDAQPEICTSHSVEELYLAETESSSCEVGINGILETDNGKTSWFSTPKMKQCGMQIARDMTSEGINQGLSRLFLVDDERVSQYEGLRKPMIYAEPILEKAEGTSTLHSTSTTPPRQVSSVNDYWFRSKVDPTSPFNTPGIDNLYIPYAPIVLGSDNSEARAMSPEETLYLWRVADNQCPFSPRTSLTINSRFEYDCRGGEQHNPPGLSKNPFTVRLPDDSLYRL